MSKVYARRCQECGHVQAAKPPIEYKGDAWQELACKKCKSIAMDYGHDGWEYRNGKLCRIEEDEDE